MKKIALLALLLAPSLPGAAGAAAAQHYYRSMLVR